MGEREFVLGNRTVAAIGRFGGLSWPEVAAKVAAAGGALRRGVSRRTDIVVIGHGAHELLPGGRLERRLALVGPAVRIVSENALLRALGQRPALPVLDRPFPLAQIAQQTKLPEAVVRTLALFDVLETDLEDRGAFRDLVAGRAVARRLGEGATLAEILAAFHRRRGNRSQKIAAGDGTRIGAAYVGEGLWGDRQMRLPLGDGGNPGSDDLFEAAYIAEEDGALETAEALYRRCLHAERRDPTAAFNLANVLSASGRAAEARIYYERALAIDATFVEARYNLAHLMDAAGETAAAKEQLGAALKVDPGYGDALFNLATLHTREGDLGAAIPCWERYLAVDTSGEWAEKAQQSLMLCRRLARAGESA